MIIRIDGEYYDVWSTTVKLIDIYNEENQEQCTELLNRIKSEQNPVSIKQYTTPLMGKEQAPDKFHGF